MTRGSPCQFICPECPFEDARLQVCISHAKNWECCGKDISLINASVQVHDDVDCRDEDFGGDEDDDWDFRVSTVHPR